MNFKRLKTLSAFVLMMLRYVAEAQIGLHLYTLSVRVNGGSRRTTVLLTPKVVQ